MNVTAIICAAGRSERFAPGTAKNKLEQDMGGRPVFMRAIEALANRPEVHRILVAVDPETVDEFKARYGDALGLRGAVAVAGGTVARWETVRNALGHIPEESSHVAIHDAARPCLQDDLLERLFEAARLFDAVIPGTPIIDTLKRACEETESAAEDDGIATAILGEEGGAETKARRIVETIPRDRIYAVQTPQVFTYELIRRAYDQSDLDSTDDATLVERLGEPVRIIEGDPLNIKITTETDLKLARDILGVRPERERPAHLRF